MTSPNAIIRPTISTAPVPIESRKIRMPPALAVLVALEQEMVGNAIEDDDEWINRAAAVRTVRDYYTQARAEKAKMN
jgi:hypothetical protein